MRALLLILTLSLGLSACTIHRIDIQQGNVITNEMVEQLKTGMTKRQVTFVMGTPLIQDPFHSSRWDYIFTLQPGTTRKITKYKLVTLLFEDDIVKDIKVVNKE